MTTLAPYANRYLRGRIRRGEITAKTARDLACRLDSLVASFGDRPLEQFGPAAIERWKERIGHMAPASRRSYQSTVGVFCRWLVKERVIHTDPMAEVAKVRQPRSVPRALSAAHVERVLDVLPDARARAIVWLMVGLGLRRGEVAALEVGDYDPVAAIVTVTGKGGHQRVVPVPPEAITAIDAYVAAVGAPYGPLIRSTTIPGAPLQPGTVGKLVSGWMMKAGVKHKPRDGVSGHAFRHTAASDVLDKCNDLRVIQQMLGHEHLSSTAIYLRRAGLSKIREAMTGRSYESAKDRPVGTIAGDRAGRNGADHPDLAGHDAELGRLESETRPHLLDDDVIAS